MDRRLLVAALVLIGSRDLPAQATAAELARCADIPATPMKLICYEALARGRAAETVSPTAQDSAARVIHNWAVTERVDPMTDRRGATYVLPAESSPRAPRAQIVLRCTRGEFSMHVNPDKFLGFENYRIVLRLDAEPPFTQRWTQSTDHSALFLQGNRKKQEEFLQRLLRHQRLSLEVRPYNETPLPIVFILEGIAQVVQEIGVLCPAASR